MASSMWQVLMAALDYQELDCVDNLNVRLVGIYFQQQCKHTQRENQSDLGPIVNNKQKFRGRKI